MYNLVEDPFEINNLAKNPDYAEVLNKHATILEHWISETDDQGQYPESEEGLKLMLGIWGKNAVNPEYDQLREKYPDLAGSLWDFKNQDWKLVIE